MSESAQNRVCCAKKREVERRSAMKYDVSKKPTRGAQRTLDAFSRSLLALLAEQPFEQVTVNELCQRAGYPRATFYNYFDDKYDLLDYGWMRIGAHLRLMKPRPRMRRRGAHVLRPRVRPVRRPSRRRQAHARPQCRLGLSVEPPARHHTSRDPRCCRARAPNAWRVASPTS